MKKLLLLFLFLPSLLFSQEFTVETSRGEQRLVIPEDMTLEEAYVQMAGLYLEERYDLEEALGEIDNLTEEVSKYIVEVEDLQREVDLLQQENAELRRLYEEERKPIFIRPIASIGAGVEDTMNYVIGSFGIQLLEDWYATTDVQYPLRLGVSVGRTF